LGVISEHTVEEVEGKSGRDKLASALQTAMNLKLEDLEGFGGIEDVFFTSFVLQ
jgi:flagellar FliL protein